MANRPTQQKNNRVLAVIIVIVIILALLGVYSHYKQKNAQQPATPTAAHDSQAPDQTVLPSPKTISSFQLTDDTGKPFTTDNLKGRWSMMFFGFTHCGDVCPLTLTELNKMYLQLQKELPADKLPQVVFVSVDPQRDSITELHTYTKNYNPNFIGATGDAENLNTFVKEMGVYFSKKPSQDPNTYGMDHSSQIFLFNPDGKWVGILTYPFQAEQLAKNFESMTAAQAPNA